MIYQKYEFDTVPEISHIIGDVVVVGHLVEVEGTYDEEGNELTAPVISPKIAVDIIWKGEPLAELEPYLVTPTKPKHTIAGQEKLYHETV